MEPLWYRLRQCQLFAVAGKSTSCCQQGRISSQNTWMQFSAAVIPVGLRQPQNVMALMEHAVCVVSMRSARQRRFRSQEPNSCSVEDYVGCTNCAGQNRAPMEVLGLEAAATVNWPAAWPKHPCAHVGACGNQEGNPVAKAQRPSATRKDWQSIDERQRRQELGNKSTLPEIF